MKILLPPTDLPSRHAVKLKKKAESFVRSGHPWVYESSIVKTPDNGKAGDIAIIFDHRTNKYLGLGLYDPLSPIRIKMLASSEKIFLDQPWFDKIVQEAYDTRLPLLDKGTTGYRLLHGENDGTPGFIADIYDVVCVIKLYSLIWIPYLHLISQAIIKTTGCEVVILRFSRQCAHSDALPNGYHEGMVIYGELLTEEVTFTEAGLKFYAQVIKGHKTGFFLDHRQNRIKVGKMSRGKTVLDVFSYAGGFSAHALSSGASMVTSLDISKHALGLAVRNVKLNVENPRHKIICGDAFEEMDKLYHQGHFFDIIVVDPPSFAKQESEINKALNSYARLARLAMRLVKRPGMIVIASCSSRISSSLFFETIEKNLDIDTQRSYRLLEKTFHDIDHPVNFPQGNYLKCGYYIIT